jgi:hypothetical protein
MIVNVNPYDTGFDENSHVMKFSAGTSPCSLLSLRDTDDGVQSRRVS